MSIVFGGKDPYTPSLVQWFYYWLIQIDTPLEIVSAERRHGELKSEEIGKLAEELGTSFLLFCNHTPSLAAEYLRSVSKHPYRDHALRELLKFRGALAQATPKELAELTADYLVPKEEEEDEEYGGPFAEAFKHRDLDFVPASPAQGPFYDLLMHAPEYGLPLM